MQSCTSCGHENPEDSRFCNACAAPLAQPSGREFRKTVTVVFCDVTGSTALGERLDPEALRRVMARYFEVMQAVVERHGGTVEKFIGDALMAVFGVPVLHEDDALRAVRAAVEMREELAGLNVELRRDHGTALELRIGVNTGEVVTGTEERLATGDAVNVASRLEQAAKPGETLLGPETVRLVRDAAEFEPVPPLTLKGKQEPVRAARLLSVARATGRGAVSASPFVGRELETRLLTDAWERACSERRAHLFTVLGMPGVGKSRLVAEFTAGLDGGVVTGRCLSYGEGITYSPVVEVVKQLSGGRPVEELTADPLGRAALGVLLGDDTMPTSPEEIAWTVRKLLETEADRRPLVVVLDDLQWGESGFLDLVEHVADLSRGAPILMLCMGRPELLEVRPGWGGGKLNATTVLLEPLTPAETDILIDGLQGATSLDSEQRSRIRERAEGNPLFVEQMLAMLDEPDAGDHEAPPTILALLAARLDQLAAGERLVLECGAVEGELFHRGALESLAPDEPELGKQLTALVRKELVHPDSSAGDDAFRFRHALVRDVAYEAMPKAGRAVTHERLANWLERAEAGIVEADELIGYHLEQAVRYRAELGPPGDHDVALAIRGAERLHGAARRAFARVDVGAAAGMLGRAVALSPTHASVSLRVDLANALLATGEYDEAKAVLAEAVRKAAEGGDGAGQMRARLFATELETHGDPSRPRDELDALTAEAIALFEAEGDDEGLLEALLTRARTAIHALRFGECITANRRALEVARTVGDPSRESQILGGIGNGLFWGEAHFDEVLAFVDAHAVLRGRPALELARANILARKGQFEAARVLTSETLERLADLGFPAGHHLGWDCILQTLIGDHAAAERSARRGCEELEARGERAVRSTLACHLALSLCELGRYDEAQEAAEQGKALSVAGDLVTEIYYARAVARVLLARDRIEEAERFAGEAVALVDATDASIDRADALVDLAAILAPARKRAEAVEALEQAAALYEAKGDLVSPTRVRARIDALRFT